MFKRKILSLLFTIAAITVGLVLPMGIAALQDRQSAEAVEPLGIELDELSMSSGLNNLEKLELFTDANSQLITVTDWEPVEAREILYSSVFGSIMSAEQRELLLSGGDQMLFVSHVFCFDNMGNQWQVYEDVETGGLLGIAVRFYWAEDLANVSVDEETTAVTNDIFDKMGVEFSQGWWATDLVYNMGATFGLDAEVAAYDVVRGESLTYFDFYNQNGSVTVSMEYDITGCWINCDKISWR